MFGTSPINGQIVWVMIPGRKLNTGIVTGRSKKGLPLVQVSGWKQPRPVSLRYLSAYSEE